MGRGRAKAKQTKVARELKYSSPTTDYDALQRELAGRDGTPTASAPSVSESDDGDDGDFDGYEGGERWASSR